MLTRSFAGLALVSILAGPARAQQVNTGWIDWTRIDAGEVLFQSTNEERGTVTIDLALGIDAGWEAIWEVITACEVAPELVPRLESCRHIEDVDDGAAGLFEQTVKPAFFLPSFAHVFRLDYFPPERIELSHVSGPIDRLEGGWRLIERPDGTIALLYTMTVNPNFPVPRFFVRNRLERDLPDVLREIRRRAEAGAP